MSKTGDEGTPGAVAAPIVGADTIVVSDCLAFLRGLTEASVDTAWVDPPYNQGVAYGNHDDNMAAGSYLSWCASWIAELARVLKPTGHLWLLISDEWQAELKIIAEGVLGLQAVGDAAVPVVRGHGGRLYPKHHVIWWYSFGVNARKKMTRSHAHLFHFVKHPTKYTWNDDAVRVPSARQLVYNDKRANPNGRLPDDTWILRPQDLPAGAAEGGMCDTWIDHRIAGTHSERVGTPNQVPEAIVERALLFSTNPGDLVLDCFVGSGTTPSVAKRLGRHYIACDNDAATAAIAAARVLAAPDYAPPTPPEPADDRDPA